MGEVQGRKSGKKEKSLKSWNFEVVIKLVSYRPEYHEPDSHRTSHSIYRFVCSIISQEPWCFYQHLGFVSAYVKSSELLFFSEDSTPLNCELLHCRVTMDWFAYICIKKGNPVAKECSEVIN